MVRLWGHSVKPSMSVFFFLICVKVRKLGTQYSKTWLYRTWDCETQP